MGGLEALFSRGVGTAAVGGACSTGAGAGAGAGAGTGAGAGPSAEAWPSGFLSSALSDKQLIVSVSDKCGHSEPHNKGPVHTWH